MNKSKWGKVGIFQSIFRLTICLRIRYTVSLFLGFWFYNPICYKVMPPVVTLNFHPFANAEKRMGC